MEPPYKLFTSKEQLLRIDTMRVIYFIIFVLSFILTEIGRYAYRPFIYRNAINDFGLADSMGNLGGIIAQIFFGLTLLNSNFKQGFSVIGFCTIGFIIYEFLQPILPKGFFDWKDVVGTFVGGLFSCLIFLLVQFIFKSTSHEKRVTLDLKPSKK